MVDIAALMPFTVWGALGILIQAVIAWIVIMIVDKAIAHNIDAKRSFILAIVALFIVPIVVGFAALPGYVSLFIVPLIVWIILGEFLLTAGAKDKLKVIVIAFIVYEALLYAGVASMVAGAIA